MPFRVKSRKAFIFARIFIVSPDREGLIIGPGGIRKFEGHFEVMNNDQRRLITIIFKGGN